MTKQDPAVQSNEYVTELISLPWGRARGYMVQARHAGGAITMAFVALQ